MASPNPMKKVKWPSDKKQAGTDVSDFVPYVSNIVNSFRRVPRPMAPKTIDPVTGTTISLADAKRQVSDTSRAADLSTKDLDAQTGAAIRVGNMASRFRSLSDLNSKEAQINSQLGNQTKMINANIDAQNTGIINQYHDDITNAQIAQQREQSENLANASDKFITQQSVKDQYKLDKEKTKIMSKMYNPGVYGRLMDSINGKTTKPFDNLPVPPPLTATTVTAKTAQAPASSSISYSGTGPLTSNADTENLPPFMRKKAPRYFMNKFAAGGMMKVFGDDTEDPSKPVLRDPIKPLPTFKGGASLSGTNAFDDKTFAMDYGTNQMAKGIDMVNSIVQSGALPHTMPNGQMIRNNLDPKMYQYLYQFNQRGDMTGMTPEQRLQAFYDIQANDPDIQSMKNNMRRYGYGPQEFSRTSPSIVKKGFGGKILKPFA